MSWGRSCLLTQSKLNYCTNTNSVYWRLGGAPVSTWPHNTYRHYTKQVFPSPSSIILYYINGGEASVRCPGQLLPFNFERGSTFLISTPTEFKLQVWVVKVRLKGEFSGIINLTKCSSHPEPNLGLPRHPRTLPLQVQLSNQPCLSWFIESCHNWYHMVIS